MVEVRIDNVFITAENLKAAQIRKLRLEVRARIIEVVTELVQQYELTAEEAGL